MPLKLLHAYGTEINLSTFDKHCQCEQRVCKIFCYSWKKKYNSLSVGAEILNIDMYINQQDAQNSYD